MATLTYRLRSSNSMYYRYTNGRDTVVTLRLPFKVNSQNEWSQKKQQIKSHDIQYQLTINEKLSRFRTYILNNTSLAEVNGVNINADWVKHQQNIYFNPPKKAEDYTLLEYIKKYVSVKGRTKHLDTLINWVTPYKSTKLKNINFKWIQSFVEIKLKKEEYAESTIGRQVHLIKSVLKFAEQNEIKINRNIYDYKCPKSTSISSYLNVDEIDIIFNYKCKSDRLENVKRLFLVGCTTGLRVSDLMRIKELPINDNFIEITTQKTKQSLIIPIDPRVKGYIQTLRPISHPVFNRYLKELCELAEINKLQKGYIRGEGNKRELGVYPKYKLITSHTMRRSFASNLYGKVPTVVIMAITGHTTERSFLTYIKKPQRDFAEQLKDYYRCNEKLGVV